MEVTLKNERIKINATFLDVMVKLSGRYTYDKYIKGMEKHNVKVRKLKNGKVNCYQEFYIPNGFIYDALCIDDSDTKEQVVEWLKKLVEDIAKQRGVEIPKKEMATTVCGKDYKCIKDYKIGNCSYTKGKVYHSMRDGYLNDDNGISWSCGEGWFKDYIKED